MKRFYSWLCLALSSGGFSGFFGTALGKPGKAGGTAGAIVALFIQAPFLLSEQPSHWLMATLVLVTFAAGCLVIHPAERLMVELWGVRKRHTGVFVTKDFNETNIDEIHGQLIAGLPIFMPMFRSEPLVLQFGMLLVSFLLFRLFDATKFWFVKDIEQWGNRYEHHRWLGPFGIMIDDTAAGCLACMGTYVLMLPIMALRLLFS